MVSKVKKTGKMLNATNKLRNEMGRHFLAIEQAFREGAPTAWATAGTPVELLYSMGVQPMLPENSATISAALKKSQNFIELAEDQGYSYDLCSYFKTNVGAVISNAEMSEGGTRKPTFMLSSDVICDTHVNWFQVQSERMGGVPHFTIDIPHVVSNTTNRQKEYFKKYIKEQLWELLDFITDITGNEYNEEKAREVAQNSYEMGKIWQDVFELRKNIPCPVSTRDTFGGLFPLFTMTGLKSPIKLYKRMYREAKERVDNGIGALEQEDFRLLFEGIPFWYDLKFFANLESWNAIIVYEPYVYAFTKYTNPEITLDMVLNNPVESMAELILSFWYIYDLETRVQKFKETVNDWNIDGVILHDNLSCRPNACGMYDLKRRLMEEADIPALVITSDMNDPRKMNETQVLNQIESFIEILRKRKSR
ncbi:MAG: 2-hydroxyacyl-CoA dehydratase subunit D [Promethearchaeota archaeon]|jgi:benzoyl-CoA reductase/2-hydroxyglutaryl-CoA dehydratase subunit BcrC/BadD/HgdB